MLAPNEVCLSPSASPAIAWLAVCALEDILPASGVCVMLGDEQIALFRPLNDCTVYALSNFDPFSKAFVLSRGLVGDRDGVLKVTSPIYKQAFDLRTGQCLDDPEVRLATYPTKVVDGRVHVGVFSGAL